MPHLSQAFDLSALGLASLVGLFYYGYSPFSLVAGAALDRLGPRRVMPVAAAIISMGALPFAIGSRDVAGVGRLLQGVGSAFVSVGTIYIASNNFRPTQVATLIGATQNVWHGRRSSQTVCSGTTDRSRSALADLLEGHGGCRVGHGRCSHFCFTDE
jgi:MFS family permease